MNALPRVPLGRTGMEVTRIGFGTWAIGGDWVSAWGPQDDADSIAAIRHAVEAGINWVDTAAAYGMGHSEEVVRTALSGYSAADRPYVFTKAGQRWDDTHRSEPLKRIGNADSIRAEAEDSLRRLGVERLDLLQMHWPAQDAPLEEYWQVFVDLKQAGKVRAIGLSNHDAKQLEAAEAMGHVDTLQPPFSAINRAVGAAELPWCLEHGTAVIVYSPMQSGLLAGRFSKERVAGLPADDWRSHDPDFNTPAIDRNLAVVEAMRPIAARHGVEVAAVAVAWALAWPAVTGAIVGARSPAQAAGWLPAAELELSGTDLAEIASVIRRTGAGVGPVAP